MRFLIVVALALPLAGCDLLDKRLDAIGPVIDSTCDLDVVRADPDFKERYLDEQGRPRSTLTPAQDRFVRTLAGNNRIIKQRCPGKAGKAGGANGKAGT